MKVNPHTGGGGCGGDETTVQISFNDGLCRTAAKLYPVGTTVNWTSEDDLNNCSNQYGNILFEPKLLHRPRSIQIQPTDKTEYYCIDKVEVVLEYKNSLVKYVKETDDKWRQGDVSLEIPYSLPVPNILILGIDCLFLIM